MKNLKSKKQQRQNTSYSMENIEHHETEEESGVWEATKEGVAKAWSATKSGAAKAWGKTKEVTEDITGLGHHKDDEEAYFEDESIIDEDGYQVHRSRGFAEDNGEFASFSEADENITQVPHHLHDKSSQHSSSHTQR